MNWEAIAAVSGIVGTMAVVVSLVYLARQLRMNSHQLQHTARHVHGSIYHSANAAFTSWFALLAQDRGTAEVWARILSGATLDEVDKVRMNALLSILFLSYENYFQQERLGVVQRGTLGHPSVGSLLAVPAISEWWDSQGPRVFTPEFRAEIARLRASLPGAPNPPDPDLPTSG
jgi:hypothetical protein